MKKKNVNEKLNLHVILHGLYLLVHFLLKQKPALVVEAYEHQLREFGTTAATLKQFILDLGYREARPADGNFYFLHSHT